MNVYLYYRDYLLLPLMRIFIDYNYTCLFIVEQAGRDCDIITTTILETGSAMNWKSASILIFH